MRLVLGPGPDRALTQIWLGMSGDSLKEKLDAVGSARHPDALGLLHALEQFLDSGLPRSIDQVAVVKVTLAGVRPALWRRPEPFDMDAVNRRLADLGTVTETGQFG